MAIWPGAVRAVLLACLLAASPDLALYRVGETARVHIEAGEKDAHVLVILAASKVHARRLVHLAGTEADVRQAAGAAEDALRSLT